MRKNLRLCLQLVLGLSLSLPGLTHAATFVMEKQNTDYAIDGNGGAIVQQQVYLWNTNLNNANQNWVQLNRGGGYYSYRKQNTSLCLDGGNGGARRQPVVLMPCETNNQNQHWRKVKVFNGTEIYRMEKRNAPGFSIDGGGGASLRQPIYLWNSNSNNVNQQWNFIRTDTAPPPPPPPPSGCNVPHDVLPMDYWKITIPFTSPNGGSDGNTSKAAEVDWPNIASYERSPYFTNSGCNYVQFRAHVGGATTNGSGYPRSELREMNFRGNEASWSSGSGTHFMEVDLRVTQLPPVKSHITVLQIHDGSDDVITFRLENKKLFLEIDGSDGPVATSNYNLGTRVTLRFEVSNNQTRAYYNGNLIHTLNQSYSGAYFKTGAYTQSACSGSRDVPGESCSSYGEVEIFRIDLRHN